MKPENSTNLCQKSSGNKLKQKTTRIHFYMEASFIFPRAEHPWTTPLQCSEGVALREICAVVWKRKVEMSLIDPRGGDSAEAVLHKKIKTHRHNLGNNQVW